MKNIKTRMSLRDFFLWVITIVALTVSLLALQKSSRPPHGITKSIERPGLVDSIDRHQALRVGYGVFPPYTYEDPKTGKVSGVSVDIINEIARQLKINVQWTRFNWNTMKADLDRGQFDVLADAVFQTPARGREMTFTEPFAYFAIGIGVVRKDDIRFLKFEDINNPKVKVAVGQGFAEETFVISRAPKATVIAIPSSTDTAAPVATVLSGRADIAIVNLDDARRYVGAHPEQLRILWADKPPAYVPAGFTVRYGDLNGAQFLTVALRNLRSTGVLRDIAKRHGVEASFSQPTD